MQSQFSVTIFDCLCCIQYCWFVVFTLVVVRDEESTIRIHRREMGNKISVASIFQILLRAIPVLIIAAEYRNASFLLRSMGIVLVSSTVTALIFGPKLRLFLYPKESSHCPKRKFS